MSDFTDSQLKQIQDYARAGALEALNNHQVQHNNECDRNREDHKEIWARIDVHNGKLALIWGGLATISALIGLIAFLK